MSEHPTEGPQPLSKEQQKVYDWRKQVFEGMGFTEQIAEALAGSKHADLQMARRLMSKGCSLSTMLRILL